jgi:hypothetical protein
VLRFDVTSSDKSLASAVAPLIPVMSGMTRDEIAGMFLYAINDWSLSISKETRQKWRVVVAESKTKTQLMFAITNLYLKAANLGVKK